MAWIAENLGTIIVCLILAVIVGAIVYFMVKNKRQGKSSCGGSCSCCPMGESCHGGKKVV